MAFEAQDLHRVMQQHSGGSEQRYRHMLNPHFIYSEGVKDVAEAAGAYWLIDMVALQIERTYAAAWRAGQVDTGFVKISVPAEGAEGRPTVSLSLQDDAPPAFMEELSFTTFPVGEWLFYLGTDEIAEDRYVTNMYLPQEY